jgi:hypothetical protein
MMLLVSYWLAVAVWALLALYACVFLAAFQPQLCCLSLEDHAAEHAECPICLGDIHAGEVLWRAPHARSSLAWRRMDASVMA